nr:MAG TPA: hypothetical protein [Caudoviricetes sp.]
MGILGLFELMSQGFLAIKTQGMQFRDIAM